MTMSRQIFLRIRNVLEEGCKENQNKHFRFNNLVSENLAFYVIMWKKYCTVGQATEENIIRRMRFPRWIPKSRDTHSE
jgi:hypothetical protein